MNINFGGSEKPAKANERPNFQNQVPNSGEKAVFLIII